MAKAHNQEEPVPNQQTQQAAAPSAKPHCGIIMPLSDTEGYPPGHWAQVQKLIIRASEKAKFTASMVSENVAEDMIHASIVRNIYHNDVVVCDVSSLNPNVMLELGMRMSTLLPLVLVFDGEIKYPFDINSILHVRYPKGLNIFKMEDFVDELSVKIRKVFDAQKKKEYQPFLSHFKEITIEPAKLESSTQSVSEAMQGIIGEVSLIRRELKSIRENQHTPNFDNKQNEMFNLPLEYYTITKEERKEIDKLVASLVIEKNASDAELKNCENGIVDLVSRNINSNLSPGERVFRKSNMRAYVSHALLIAVNR